jgi:hypothetical protein
MTLLPIAKIRTDGGTQPRASIDFAAVDDYMAARKLRVCHMNSPEYSSDRDYYSWLNGPDDDPEDEIGGANIPAEDDAVGEPMTCPF